MNQIILPTNPGKVTIEKLQDACRTVYEKRADIISSYDLSTAQDMWRKALAIERYVVGKEAKKAARRAARVLETCVGEALGPPERGERTDLNISHTRDKSAIPKNDRHRFRTMAEHKDDWWPVLEQKALSRREVLFIIEDKKEDTASEKQNKGEALLTLSDANSWLKGLKKQADLLLTDPPYSTDLANVKDFVKTWLPLCLSKLKPSARAFIFVGAYAEELAAYFSQSLPPGWRYGVPHAWCYRNTIGPTPTKDFIRNWQCIVSLIGPEASNVRSMQINDLLSGVIENAPDGRHEQKFHKWQKPVGLAKRLIRVTTDADDILIDPFAGSGTFLLQAKELNRKAAGCEKDKECYETALKRGCEIGRI